MQFFGVPICPYCKKRVNLIRTWSLKKQGEYRCPRCGGISNIFLSPLIYVFALFAVFSGGAIYFFHKFILEDVTLHTAVQVLIPFVVFFLLSLFMVYLAKPVIKKVSREELEKKKKGKSRDSLEERRNSSASSQQTGKVFPDQGDYLPQASYRTGPVPQPLKQQPSKTFSEPLRTSIPANSFQKTTTIPLDRTQAISLVKTEPKKPQAPAATASPRRISEEKVVLPEKPSVFPEKTVSQRSSAVGAVSRVPQQPSVSRPSPVGEPRRASRIVSSVEIPSGKDDFFAKYDDPAYIERRLKELKEEREETK